VEKKLKYIQKTQGKQPDKVLVAIHGWRGNQKSMVPLIPSFNFKNTVYYFPEAPYQVNGNPNEYSWSYQKSSGRWEVEAPTRLLQNFFTDIFSQYTSENVYVMGFSQGGLVCLDIVLQFEQPLGGVFPIAGFLRDPEVERERCHPNQLSTPVIICHGKSDDRVPAEYSKKAFQLLQDQGANVELLLYNGKHKIGIECIRRMKEIIQEK